MDGLTEGIVTKHSLILVSLIIKSIVYCEDHCSPEVSSYKLIEQSAVGSWYLMYAPKLGDHLLSNKNTCGFFNLFSVIERIGGTCNNGALPWDCQCYERLPRFYTMKPCKCIGVNLESQHQPPYVPNYSLHNYGYHEKYEAYATFRLDLTLVSETHSIFSVLVPSADLNFTIAVTGTDNFESWIAFTMCDELIDRNGNAGKLTWIMSRSYKAQQRNLEAVLYSVQSNGNLPSDYFVKVNHSNCPVIYHNHNLKLYLIMVVVEKLSIGPLRHGTGPVWDNKKLAVYVTDLQTGDIYRYDYFTKESLKLTIDKQPVSFIVPVFYESNNFICGEGNAIKKFNWDVSNNTATNVEILEYVPESNDIQLNVGKCDACGHLWVGTTSDIPYFGPSGALYVYRTFNGAIKQLSDIYSSSGITWNLQNTKLFHVDSMNTTIDSFDLDIANGLISNRQEVFDFKKNNIRGSPSGITTDERGNLWVGCYEGSQVININPETGSLLSTIKFPTNQITSLAFGGRTFEELFVTSAGNYFRNEDTVRYTDAGSVYKVKYLNVKGALTYEFIVE